MSVFRQAVMRQKVHHTLATLHHKALAVGPYWWQLAVLVWGLWANAGKFALLEPQVNKHR